VDDLVIDSINVNTLKQVYLEVEREIQSIGLSVTGGEKNVYYRSLYYQQQRQEEGHRIF
jgi:hypothetical protein